MIENPEKLNTQAINLASKGEYAEAIACFKRALTIEKKNYFLWYNLGVTYRDAGKLQKAKEALLVAYKLEEEDEDIIETLVHVCFLMNDLEEALMFCAEGLEYNCQNAHLWNNSGVIYFSKGDYEIACEAFERAVMIDPNYYDALYNLRDTYEQLGNKNGTKECAEKLKNLSQGGSYAK